MRSERMLNSAQALGELRTPATVMPVDLLNTSIVDKPPLRPSSISASTEFTALRFMYERLPGLATENCHGRRGGDGGARTRPDRDRGRGRRCTVRRCDKSGRYRRACWVPKGSPQKRSSRATG